MPTPPQATNSKGRTKRWSTLPRFCAFILLLAGLVGHGLRITLLESRPRLGGRASSFSDPATGELVDNCQHVSMACCTVLRLQSCAA